MIAVIQIAVGVAIGFLCPPIGIAFCFWYLFLRGK